MLFFGFAFIIYILYCIMLYVFYLLSRPSPFIWCKCVCMVGKGWMCSLLFDFYFLLLFFHRIFLSHSRPFFFLRFYHYSTLVLIRHLCAVLFLWWCPYLRHSWIRIHFIQSKFIGGTQSYWYSWAKLLFFQGKIFFGFLLETFFIFLSLSFPSSLLSSFWIFSFNWEHYTRTVLLRFGISATELPNMKC